MVNLKIVTSIFAMKIQLINGAQKHFAVNLKILVNMDAPHQLLSKIVFGTTFAHLNSAKATEKVVLIHIALQPNATPLHLPSNVPMQPLDASMMLKTATGICATLTNTTSTQSIVTPPGAPKPPIKANLNAKRLNLQSQLTLGNMPKS